MLKIKDLINNIKPAEKYVSKMQSLRKKTSSQLIQNQQEVKISSGASSYLGKLILKLCKNYAKNASSVNEEFNEMSSNDSNDIYNSILQKPFKREYILRTSASRPAPFSRQSPLIIKWRISSIRCFH